MKSKVTTPPDPLRGVECVSWPWESRRPPLSTAARVPAAVVPLRSVFTEMLAPAKDRELCSTLSVNEIVPPS